VLFDVFIGGSCALLLAKTRVALGERAHAELVGSLKSPVETNRRQHEARLAQQLGPVVLSASAKQPDKGLPWSSFFLL
jgi:hypothetical protein